MRGQDQVENQAGNHLRLSEFQRPHQQYPQLQVQGQLGRHHNM